jgi:Asp-tRNA(Asn)/Glu-tRNA(Gln) amidotransferase B subunit
MKELGRYHDFNIRVLYYEGNVPGLKYGNSTDILLWNIITLYYHEYTDILDSMKESFKKEPIIGSFVINAINFVTNEMATFCNEHKVPDPRPSKAGEMIPLPIDEYPIWLNNLEDFIADLTWSKKDRRIMMKEVLPRMLNTFEVYRDVVEAVDFTMADSSEIMLMAQEAISLMPDKIEEYRKGKKGVINAFLGEIMKKSKGKVNAADAKKILEDILQ